MYSDTDLESAVAAGVISPAQAGALRAHVSGLRATAAVDEEHFRLLTGFNDIFVGIATVILLVAVGSIGNAIPPKLGLGGPSPWAGVAVAGTAWLLAEFFTRKRRMALPSILLLLAFVGGVIVTTGFSLVLAIGERNLDGNESLAAPSWLQAARPARLPRGCTGAGSRCRSPSRRARRRWSASASACSASCSAIRRMWAT
jgi:hypothetical protein